MFFRLFCAALIPGFLGLQQAYATTYYVSAKSGVDETNSGTSLSAPLKTIKKALELAWSEGDIIYVRGGTYVETVYIGQSGITLSAYQNEKPVIDGQETLPRGDWGVLINIEGDNNVVSGFEVKNCNINGAHLGGYGVQVTGTHNRVSRMNVHHTWENGILVRGDYNIVEDSSVWQAARSNFNGTQKMWASGLSAARNRSAKALKPGITSYATLRRNRVYNNWSEGLSCYEADHCTVEDNIVYDNWTVNLYLSDATNSVVQRNMVYLSTAQAVPTRNNARSGIVLADEVAEMPRSSDNRIINNFVYNANFSAFDWTIVKNSGLRNVLIANNTIVDGDLYIGGGDGEIFHSNSFITNNIIEGTKSRVTTADGLTFSYNNWHKTPPLALSATDVDKNPFLSKAGPTGPGALTPAFFKVALDSPMIDVGVHLESVKEDFFKTSRGDKPDIGGHEYIDPNAPKE